VPKIGLRQEAAEAGEETGEGEAVMQKKAAEISLKS